MTLVARVQIESEFQLLKLESAKRIAAINEHFRNLRFEARAELSDNIYKLSKVYNDVIKINKQDRRRLWLEKCRIENSFPVDVDALSLNSDERAELKRQAAVLTAQLDADIKSLKRAYSLKKQGFINEENRQLIAVKDDINARRAALMDQLVSLAEKGGNQ